MVAATHAIQHHEPEGGYQTTLFSQSSCTTHHKLQFQVFSSPFYKYCTYLYLIPATHTSSNPHWNSLELAAMSAMFFYFLLLVPPKLKDQEKKTQCQKRTSSSTGLTIVFPPCPPVARSKHFAHTANRFIWHPNKTV